SRIKLTNLKLDLENKLKELEDALLSGKYELAGKLKYTIIPDLEKEIQAIQSDTSLVQDAVNDSDVAKVISKQTGIPMTKLLMSDREKLLNVDKELKLYVVGQNNAIDKISNCIRI